MELALAPELTELTYDEMIAVNGGDTAYVPGPIGDDGWWNSAVNVIVDIIGFGGGLSTTLPF